MDGVEDLSPWCPFPNLVNERAECSLLVLSLQMTPLKKALFLCKPFHPTDPQS